MTPIPDPATRIGIGRRAEVFALADGVLKLLAEGEHKTAAFREAAHLSIAESAGLPVPSVRSVDAFGNRWGISMGRATGPSLAERLMAPDASPRALLAEASSLQARLHSAPGHGLPALILRLRRQLHASGLPTALQDRLLAALDARPAGASICHFDFHPHNVIGIGNGATVIDWLDACSGPPAADIARSWLLLRLGAPDLAPLWFEIAGNTEVEGWVPILAGARLAEHVSPSEGNVLIALAQELP